MASQQDWETIKSTTGEYSNPWIRYVWQQTGVEYAVCHKGWRENGPIAPRTSALLQFYAREMDELWAHFGPSWIYGALIDFALKHRDGYHEFWFNGEML